VFHRRCIVRSCTRVATSNVEVWWRILTMHVVRRDRGSGRTTARAGVCPGHEHALALGELLPVSGNARASLDDDGATVLTR
jgi:hypothetical protein